jgi:hypothetical protein
VSDAGRGPVLQTPHRVVATKPSIIDSRAQNELKTIIQWQCQQCKGSCRQVRSLWTTKLACPVEAFYVLWRRAHMLLQALLDAQ